MLLTHRRNSRVLLLGALAVALGLAAVPRLADSSTPPITDIGLEALRQCESGGDYTINTGNGYYGAYQYLPSTWRHFAAEAGHPEWAGVLPHQAPPEIQDAVTRHLWNVHPRAWPTCHRRALAAMAVDRPVRGSVDRVTLPDPTDPTVVTVGGWADDPDLMIPVQVELYGAAIWGPEFVHLATVPADHLRPDVGSAAYHLDLTLPGNRWQVRGRDAGIELICARVDGEWIDCAGVPRFVVTGTPHPYEIGDQMR
jgi:hypothetical protein